MRAYDADTFEAVAKQIARGLWGRSQIPARWLGRKPCRAEIERMDHQSSGAQPYSPP